MAQVRKTAWKKIKRGTSGLQLRVRDFVRKLRPERVRWQWRHLLADHWLPTSTLSPRTPADSLEPQTPSENALSCGTQAETEGRRSEGGDPEVAERTAATDSPCQPAAAEPPMSSVAPLPVASTDEELGRSAANGGGGGGNGGGSVRPNELSLGGGSLVPPAAAPRNKSPVTVQEWVDSLPLTPTDDGQVTRGEEESEPRIVLTQDTDDNLTLGAEAGLMCGPLPPTVQVTTHREPSESGSHCSSVESLLEARRPDPEEVLLSLGFGGGAGASECRIPQRFLQPSRLKRVAIDIYTTVLLSLGFGGGAGTSECRIPQRFLQPSRLKGVAIDDFLRHQQEMVTNFETGFCGYRGLSGPSHTMPSVIVAKIMEKLREHERESCSAASPPHASTNTDRNHNQSHNHNHGNRFSRAARNVITNLRSPGTSVLTPDNRAWLDSQNQRSPEVARKRIIIGQQSFTFSRDGDLIESPPSSLTDSDSRWTSSTGTQPQKADLSLVEPSFPSIQEAGEPSPPSPSPLPPAPAAPRHAFANVVTSLLAEKNQESKLSNSSTEARSVGDSGVGLPSSGRSSRGLDEFDSPVTSPVTADHPLHSAEETISLDVPAINLRRVNEATADHPLHSIEETYSLDVPANNLRRVNEVIDESPVLSSESDDRRDNELKETNRPSDRLHEDSLQNSQAAQTSFNRSGGTYLNEECKVGSNFNNTNNFSEPPCRPNLSSDSEKRHSVSESDSNVLLENLSESSDILQSNPSLQPSDVTTSSFPSLASELKQVQQLEGEQSRNVRHVSSEAAKPQERNEAASAPVRVIESLDKVIESLEKIMEPLEVIAESDLQFNSAVRSQSEKDKLIHSYEDLRILAQQLLEAGVPVEVGSPEHFLSLTVNERCEVQCRLVRLALSSYQAQLALDTTHYELKCCLGAEVTRLSDLLDTANDPDKLSTLVRQMTELLKHQCELSRELAQWTSQSPEPGCHQLCEVVLRRLRALELLVHRNTRALSDLRNQVSH